MRLSNHIREVVRRGEKALGIFVTSGFPDKTATLPILRAIDGGGADFIELGMPFSDPIGEGLPIQHSSELALQGGITMRDTLETARLFREQSDTPLVLMGYANPVVKFGISNFFKAARSSGVDGVILPDVPPVEDSPFYMAASAEGVDFISLIAPTTPDDRIRRIDRMASGFVYAVSVAGVTGGTLGDADPIVEYLRNARRLVTNNPLLVGFGIRSARDVVRMSAETDGAILGSALVLLIDELWKNNSLSQSARLARIESFVNELKKGPVNA